MGTGYTRQSEAEISDGEIIFADAIEAELDAIQAAFHGITGASHDGTAGEGPKILLTNGSSVTGILPKENGGTGVSTYSLPTATGSANAISVTANESFVTYVNGQEVWYKAIANNTGSTTLNANAIGGKKQYKSVPDQGMIELEEGDILTGEFYLSIYDTSLDAPNGGWHLQNPSGKLTRHNPLARTSSIIKMGDVGNEATLKFRSLLGVDRATIYYDNSDGKLYIKSFNSSGVAVGDPIVFNGNELIHGDFSSVKFTAEAVLNNIVAFDDDTNLFIGGQINTWITWPLTEAFDPRGIVSVASNQFTVTDDCYINWTAAAGVTIGGSSGGAVGVKTRLYDVTAGEAVFWSTILGAQNGISMSSGSVSNTTITAQGMMQGYGVVAAGHTYEIQVAYRSSGTSGAAKYINTNFRNSTGHWEDFPSLLVNLRTISPV